MLEKNKELWERCVAFHGHACGGLAVGYQASLYAMELLGVSGRAQDEELVCVTENDACGVDAVQRKGRAAAAARYAGAFPPGTGELANARRFS